MYKTSVTSILLRQKKVPWVERFLPTAVSCLRFVALPFLIVLISGGHVFLAGMIFLGAILTDNLDAYPLGTRRIGVG